MGTEENMERKLQENLLAGKAEAAIAERKQSLPKAFKSLYTISLYATFIAFGLCRGLYGPSLGELQLITGEPLSRISTVFTWLGTGAIVGSITYGFLFDYFRSLPLFIATQAAWGAVTSAIPWCRQMPLLMTVCGLQSCLFTGIAVGCNVTILRLWRSCGSPALLGLHVLFTFGCFLAPLLAEPFLAQDNTAPAGLGAGNASLHERVTAMAPSSQAISNTSGLQNTSAAYVAESRIYITYFITGCYIELNAIFNIILYIIYRKCQISPVDEPTVCTVIVRDTPHVRYASWVLFVFFAICFGGMETNYSGLLFTFGNVHVGMDKAACSKLVAGSFAAFGAGRLILVVCSRFVHIRYLLAGFLMSAVFGSAALVYIVDSSELGLWICACLVLFGCAPLFGSCLVWARDFLQVTGRFCSTYVVAYTVGMMTWPLLTGHMLQTSGALWFPCVGAGLLVGCCVSTVTLWTIRCTMRSSAPASPPVQRLADREDGVFASMQSLHAI